MSLIYCDSFDQVKLFQMRTLPSEGSATLSIQSVGLSGGNGLRMGLGSGGTHGHLEVDLLANKATIIMGGYFQLTANNTSDLSARDRFDLMTLYDEDDALPQFRLAFESSGRNFQVFRGTTLIETTAALIDNIEHIFRSHGWHYIEMKVTIDDTVGAYEVRLNGVTILSDSGVDTKRSTNAYATHAIFGQMYTSNEDNYWVLDSMYVCDDEGSINNDFLGAVRVEYLAPGQAGLYDYWQEYEAGSQVAAVDESGDCDDDSTFISSPHANSPLGNKAIGDISTFKNDTGITEGAAVIHAIALNVVARGTRERDDSARQIAGYYGHNKTYVQASANALNPRLQILGGSVPLTTKVKWEDIVTAYYNYQWISETNVRTAAAWSVGDITAIDFGVKLTA